MSRHPLDAIGKEYKDGRTMSSLSWKTDIILGRKDMFGVKDNFVFVNYKKKPLARESCQIRHI